MPDSLYIVAQDATLTDVNSIVGYSVVVLLVLTCLLLFFILVIIIKSAFYD